MADDTLEAVELSAPVGTIVREFFPDATDRDVDFILWEKTGFPAFWDGEPEESLRRQLDQYRRARKLKRDVCYGCGKIRWPSEFAFFMCCYCEERLLCMEAQRPTGIQPDTEEPNA